MIPKLGKYTIVEKLGEGAMGAVYKAYDEILGRYVAVKTMAEDIKWDQELKLRFYREARSAASLQHPNIVIIHDLGEEGKITYIVMELLEGKDLKGIIRDREKITLESKLMIMAQFCEGLSHAHQRGIIHRDVKPGNIHVTPAGNVKILDFGIARIPSSDLTRSGVRLGTPVYMSPEQIRGGHYDERSDMFSAGIVFYEFLTYTHPFRDKNIVKTMDNILFQTQLPFAEQMPDAPPGLVSVLSTCMAKEPEKRYGSMAEVARLCRKTVEDLGAAAKRYRAEVELAAPAVLQAAERPGAPAPVIQLAQLVREALRRDEKASYIDLKTLHASLGRAGFAGPAMIRPSQAASPVREEPVVPRRDSTVAPGQVTPQRAADNVLDDPAATARAIAMFESGQSLMGQDRPEEALTLLRQALAIVGPREEYVQLLAEARRRIEERKKSRVGELLKAANDALAAGQFTAALEAVTGVLELEPNRADAVDLRRQAVAGEEAEKARVARKEQGDREKTAGFKLLADGKFRESLRALQRARELLGEDTAVRIGLEEAEEGLRAGELKAQVQAELAEALQLFQAGVLDKARVRVHRALELSPRNAEALELLPRIEGALQRKERSEKAATLLREARQALGQKAFDQAAALASDASALDSESDASRLLAEIAEHKEATRRFEEIKLLLRKAEDALERFDYDEAELQAAEAIRVSPGHPEAEELGRRARRERDERRRKLELDGIITEAQQAFLKGTFAQSEAHARRALALDPGNSKAQDILGRIEAAYEKMRKDKISELLATGETALTGGDGAAASEKARSALEIEPQNKDALAFLKRAKLFEEQRRREQIEELLARSRNAFQEQSFEQAKELVRQVLVLESSNKSARTMLKDIEKVERAGRRQREKEAQDKGKDPKKQAAASREGPSPLLQVPPQRGAAPLENTVIIPPPASERKPRTGLWIAVAAALVVMVAAGTAVYWYLQRPEPQVVAGVSEQIAAAKASVNQQNYDEAIRILQPLAGNPEADAVMREAQDQKQRKETELLLVEAQSQRSQGLAAEARLTLQRILDRDPGNEAALGVVAELDAEAISTQNASEQDAQIQKWLASASVLLTAGKLPEAQAEADKIAQVRPTAPGLQPLRRQITAKRAELAQKQLQVQQAAQREARAAELSRTAQELFRAAKYADAQSTLDHLLEEDPNNTLALALRAQSVEAASAMRAYNAANDSNNYDEALRAIARLEKANPSDPVAGELRKRTEARKAAAKGTISIMRLAEPAPIFLDGVQIGTGEVENRHTEVGRHVIEIRTARGRSSTTVDLFDGANRAFVYDAARPEIRDFAPGDRDLLNKRAFREEVVPIPVEHSHGLLRGNCEGQLLLSGEVVEYKASDPKHNFRIPFGSLKLSVNGDRLEFVDVHNEKYNFKVGSVKAAASIAERWKRLKTK